MTYLELVQFAMRRAGVREDMPSTLVGASGIVLDFAEWVNDAWEEIQIERENPPWWFRTLPDQTLAIVSGTDEYSMPAGLETIDWDTITAYTTSKVDETKVYYIPYLDWRMGYDTATYTTGRPQKITLKPDNSLAVFPVPDADYTMRFNGILDLEELSADADTPTGLPAMYHRVLGWDAVRKFAEHHEDGTMLAKAQGRHKKYYKRVLARQLPVTNIEKGTLYSSVSFTTTN